MTNLVLAGPNQDISALWKQGLDGFVCTTLSIFGLCTLLDDIVRINPEMLLLDFDLLKLNDMDDSANLKKLCTATKVIVLSGNISEDMEWGLLKAGVRGCCPNDSKPQFIRQVVEAVQQGELWIRRTLTCRLIDELGKTTSKNKTYQASLSMLNNLTQREFDIAVRVGSGENNKQIASACAITERTVKFHLTEVYQKLGVSGRVNLALILSADQNSTNGKYE